MIVSLGDLLGGLRRRQTLFALRRLDDRLLDDIGIGAGHVLRVRTRRPVSLPGGADWDR